MVTLVGSSWESACSPYHLDYEQGGLRNTSFAKPPASEPREGYPSVSVKFSFPSFSHSHSSVGILTETLPGATVLDPAKGLSSEVAVELSTSGIWDQPI